MLQTSEGPSSVIDNSAAQGALSSIEYAQGVVKGQSGNQALLWKVAHMRHCPIMHPTATHIAPIRSASCRYVLMTDILQF